MKHLHLKPLLLLLGLFLASAQAPENREYQVKAAFIFNFTQFVDWPPATFTSPATPFVIGILGDDPFSSYLQETIEGEKVGQHPIYIQHFKTADEIKDCQILFIKFSDVNKTTEALALLKGKSILTISDESNFIKQGGIIRFITHDDKIQFQINPDAAKANNLTISSRLLNVAEIVIPKK